MLFSVARKFPMIAFYRRRFSAFSTFPAFRRNASRSMAKPADMKRACRILVIQTQAENAGAQEISRLVGAGLAARGFGVPHLFFFLQSSSFEAPPHTSYCGPGLPGTPLG